MAVMEPVKLAGKSRANKLNLTWNEQTVFFVANFDHYSYLASIS